MTQKTALITGASRGIGAALAHTFASHGYNLVLTAHHSTVLLEQLSCLLKEKYVVNILTSIGDIGNPQYIEHLFLKEIPDFCEGIDLLINNAGISHIGLLQEMSVDQWQHIINTNLTSVFLCSKYAIPFMLQKQEGQIINISSVWGNVGASCEVAYSASKGGVNSFTKALAKELAPSNITVNALACGIVHTQMNQSIDADSLLALKEEIPSGRFAQPEEIATMVYSLASAPSYLTGQVITMDGGWI